MMEFNRKDIGINYELLEKNVRGVQTFIIKELLQGTNVSSDVQLIGEYIDYYLIEQNGDLALYDKVGLVEKYRKVNNHRDGIYFFKTCA